MMIYWSYYALSQTEATDLAEWWDVLLKTQLQHQLVGDTLCGWGKLLQQVVNALNQCPTYGILSPAAKIHKFKNQGLVIKTAAWPLWAPHASESTRVTVLM